jgi:hypothetical protein
MISTSINIPENDIISFFFKAKKYSTLYIIPHFLYPFISGRTPRLIKLGYCEQCTIHMGVQVSLLYTDLHSFGYMPKSGLIE